MIGLTLKFGIFFAASFKIRFFGWVMSLHCESRSSKTFMPCQMKRLRCSSKSSNMCHVSLIDNQFPREFKIGTKTIFSSTKKMLFPNELTQWLTERSCENFWKKLLTKWNSQTHMWENNRVIYSTWHTNLLLHETPGHEDMYYDQIR